MMLSSGEIPIALVDMDGTLADFTEAMVSGMSRLASPGEPPWIPDGDEEKELPHIRERRRLIKSIPGFWSGLGRLTDGFEILEVLLDVGFHLTILTKAPKKNPLAWKEKVEWCDQNLHCQYEVVTLTESKGVVYGNVLVDDWPDYVSKWLQHRPRGLVVMPTRPYNASFSHPQVWRFPEILDERSVSHLCVNSVSLEEMELEPLLQRQYNLAERRSKNR